MLVWLAHYLEQYYHGFQVFQYLTLRSILSTVTAFAISLMVGPWMIARLNQYSVGQVVRESGPQSHLSKTGTPTMGGALILAAVLVSTLLWGDWGNRFLGVVLGVTLGYGLIGLWDDYRKLVLQDSKGLAGRWKLFWQSAIALLAGCFLWLHVQNPAETHLIVPFFKDIQINLGWCYIPMLLLVVVGSSNAVNLTDGLDGLAILPTVLVSAALAVLAYLAGHVHFAHYLAIAHVAGAGELTVFCGALVGAGLGFLWFNAYPAQVFMGDVGALALGAALGIVAMIVRQELLLMIMGGVFVLEAVSVMLQVASFKLTGKRIFKMAPIHHHFELKGWPEPRIIVRFWIVTLILVLVSLATLKLR